MLQYLVKDVRGLLESYVNDESGQDQFEKYDELNDFDILTIIQTTIEIEKNHNKDITKNEFETTLIGVFDNYY